MAREPTHRDNLVNTAMRLFRRQGYASTGLQQILAESGAPRGSLYHYFPGGKEALGAAAVERAGELIAAMLSELAARHPGDPAAFVSGYCATMARWMEESAFQSGCPVATTILETVPQSASITGVASAVLDRWTDIIAGVFLTSTGAPDEARRRAQCVVAAMEGALILARVRQSAAPILEIAAAMAGTVQSLAGAHGGEPRA
jgi:TetR/AcrR family transcriptional regulator, lmrAB and yxaGH operons repressor